ncbi:MAG: hypothetical protein M1826_005282 [Phylliscum demangeonii]|nr:MAG: hypothetical protein M1826_005282 [Phylliscum demangeonii]
MTPSDGNDSEDDGVDLELLALLRQSMKISPANGATSAAAVDTHVLTGAQYVSNQAIDVALDSASTRAAADHISRAMQRGDYSMQTWSQHDLHPSACDGEATVDFIFTMDLLNFSFWSETEAAADRFQVRYRGQVWTGYWSLVAALRRAVDEDIPITQPAFWCDEDQCTLDRLRTVFRSETAEEMPLLEERLACLREAGQVLCRSYGGRFANVIDAAAGSATALVNLVAEQFPCFRDEVSFDHERVRFLKRAQILVADLWACFDGKQWGEFRDIDKITAFADYRIPQILHSLGCLRYSPALETHIRLKRPIVSGHSWEVQLRGCSVWCVDLIRREIARKDPHATVHAILIDFFLYDTMKERELDGKEDLPHHRTRSIWY